MSKEKALFGLHLQPWKRGIPIEQQHKKKTKRAIQRENAKKNARKSDLASRPQQKEKMLKKEELPENETWLPANMKQYKAKKTKKIQYKEKIL